MRSIQTLLLLGLGLLVTACGGKDKRILVDPTFSYNVARIPDDWPREPDEDGKKGDWHKDPVIAQRQQRVYEEMGKPDYFNLIWRRDGKPVTTQEVTTQQWIYRKAKNKPFVEPMELGWIYMDKGRLIRFSPSETKDTELPDEIRTICDYGDPNDIKEVNDASGEKQTLYSYYAEGKVIYFRQGKKIKEDDQPRIEGFYDRR